MTWFQFSHPYEDTQEDDTQGDESTTKSEARNNSVDDNDSSSDYSEETHETTQERLVNIFFERLKQMHEETASDRITQSALFTQECRLHFLTFWMTDKRNWLADLNKDHLDFLRFLLSFQSIHENQTNILK